MRGAATITTITTAASAAATQLQRTPARKSMAARNEVKLRALPVSFSKKTSAVGKAHIPTATATVRRSSGFPHSGQVIREKHESEYFGHLRGLKAESPEIEPTPVAVHHLAEGREHQQQERDAGPIQIG